MICISKFKIFFIAISLVVGIFTGAYAQKKVQPNILLIITDQHQAEALSIAGNTDLKTPNLDRLAKSGMRFEKTYVSFPLCTPSRSSIFTGKMPHTLGVNSNEKGDDVMNPFEKELLLSKVLQQAGYDCAYAGKWHVPEPSMVAGNGFEMIAPMGDIGLAEKSIDYLKSKKKSSKPFFLTVSFDNPHNICEWARNEPLPYGNIPEVHLNKTPQLPKNHLQEASFPEVLKIEQEASKKIYPTANYREEDWRQYRYAYYKLIEKVDAEIGKILNAIDDLNLRENTLIIFTSDHGDGNASHGWNQKTALIEESIKVPFIASYNGKIKTNQVNATLITNGLDLYPTIFEYANIAIPKQLNGKSLKPIFEIPNSTLERDYIVVETKFEGKTAYGTSGRAVVGKRYKYVLYSWGKNREQLFDLEKDPLEINNLAHLKSHLKTLDQYRLYLYEWCKSTNDNSFLKKIILPSTSKLSSSLLFDKPY
ncbi:MAG: sulfatase-like hydrolase/transferase [Chitinophagaceae bacterium]